MRMVQVPLGERSYDIHIGENIWPAISEIWPQRLKPGQVLLVSDENVFGLYGGKLIAALHEAGFSVTPAVVPAGEESKTLKWADTLYTAAIEAGLDRSGFIVALGGGVVGDLAGFVAATYLRGVPFVQVPTTLLAQVDSSVGGKTAVNHRLGKNLIGAFYQPQLVWIELETLATLPKREYLAGAAEVVKYGVILHEPLITLLEKQWDGFIAGETPVLTEVIGDCCALKARVVAEDEREGGLRAILNFGHTLGHALETATSYKYYLHGEAVLAGMVLAVQLAQRRELLTEEEARRLLRMFARVGLRPAPPGLQAEAVLGALKQDKKREGDDIVFILPETIGKVRSFKDVDPQAVADVLAAYLDAEGSLLPDAD
ncbi:3-dehydroquinate synthase [Dethiobacter alkaliphilus]|uniref:3-dehydroquinate synthase n=1 Tax=Dethiobacter alkaliphilus TaxID=427926 RepID=UPI0022271311|nr:3-dehydroquinate synthase [Dethiobacter alkaliphilus]MCW3491280.1 3-dehydroquinate synthase [Dethiobacter alkaliphilus]